MNKPEIKNHSLRYLQALTGVWPENKLKEARTLKTVSMPRQMKFSRRYSVKHASDRLRLTKASLESQAVLLPPHLSDPLPNYENNIENFAGIAQIPIGLAGPLQINGCVVQDQLYIPLATTEGALVASYTRGAQLISAAGGCNAIVIEESVSRTPCFAFYNVLEAVTFQQWVLENSEALKKVAEATTRYGKLIKIDTNIVGHYVYLVFEYTTGDAAGQNMVTIATERVFQFLKENSPIKPIYAQLEGNYSSDKKVSARSLQHVRGKKAIADVRISAELLKKYFFTTPKAMDRYWRMCCIGGILAGYIGVQAHLANALAALYIACGQDVACVSESAMGITNMEEMDDGSLYASVTLPNLIVGTVGGGTHLPTQKACLDILGINSEHNSARAFAEIAVSICLAGELSLSAAMCTERFANAHHRLGRSRTTA